MSTGGKVPGTDCGIVRPSAFAVSRFITSSNAQRALRASAAARGVAEQGMPVIVAPREERTVVLEIVFVHGRDGVLTRCGNRTRRGPEHESRAQSGVEVVTAECPLERREGGFAGAVAGRDVTHVELIAQGRDDS